MTAPLTKEQERVAMSSPEHLKRWLVSTGRNYVVFRAVDLIDSLSWPNGVATFMSIVDAYRAYRREQVVETSACPRCAGRAGGTPCRLCQGSGEIPARTKTDVLEPDEIDEAIMHLQRLKSDLLDSRGQSGGTG